MTDKEIIKALECCCNTESFGCSKDCPLYNYEGVCWDTMKFNVINLINRQKAEIERLGKDSKRLKKVQMQLDDAMKMYSTIKAEAIKEFAERLKEYINRNEVQTAFFGRKCFIDEEAVDNLVKEMAGENT